MIMPHNFAVFGIVEIPPEGKIVLVQEKGNFHQKKWKLPGGRPQEHENIPEYILMRELDNEVGVITEPLKDEDLIFQRELTGPAGVRYDFIVYSCRYYSGELKAKGEIERCEAFGRDKILELISTGEVLPLHAEALKKYIEKVEDAIARHALYGD